jgi:hypothetical protein
MNSLTIVLLAVLGLSALPRPGQGWNASCGPEASLPAGVVRLLTDEEARVVRGSRPPPVGSHNCADRSTVLDANACNDGWTPDTNATSCGHQAPCAVCNSQGFGPCRARCFTATALRRWVSENPSGRNAKEVACNLPPINAASPTYKCAVGTGGSPDCFCSLIPANRCAMDQPCEADLAFVDC